MAAHASGQRFVNARPTLVDVIMSAKNLPDKDKEYTRVSDEVTTIAAAGSETTASVLRTISYHLYSKPDLLAHLRTELQSFTDTLTPGEEATWAQLSQLPYLTAVIMEGLRLSPGLVSRMARVATEEMSYAGWVIPAGTPVGMTTILMHYDENIYKDAKEFNPGRYMDQEQRWKLEKYFAPFSRGSRDCLGRQ